MSRGYYQSICDEISAKFERISEIVSHSPSIGSYHESILRSIVSSILPNTISVKTGFVLTSTGISPQTDFLVIHETDPYAYVFKEAEFAIVHARAVSTIGEVKTNITKAEFIESFGKCIKTNQLYSNAGWINSFIFSYGSGPKTVRGAQSWLQAAFDKHPGAQTFQLPDIIVFFENGVICIRDKSTGNDRDTYKIWSPAQHEKIRLFITQRFISSILGSCERKFQKPTPGNPGGEDY